MSRRAFIDLRLLTACIQYSLLVVGLQRDPRIDRVAPSRQAL